MDHEPAEFAEARRRYECLGGEVVMPEGTLNDENHRRTSTLLVHSAGRGYGGVFFKPKVPERLSLLTRFSRIAFEQALAGGFEKRPFAE